MFKRKNKRNLQCATHLIRHSDHAITILNWPGLYNLSEYEYLKELYEKFYSDTHFVLNQWKEI